MHSRNPVLAFAACFLCAGAALAQPPADDNVSELAKKTQNPVGDVTAIPIQVNFNNGGDLGDRTSFNLNLQPVIPFKVSDAWMMISRTVIPIDAMPGPGDVTYSGAGDIQQQLYLTPAHPGRFIWGAGPIFSLPTAMATPLRTGTWAAGIGAVGLTTIGPFVTGALVNQYWPLSDTGGDPETNLFVLQPFVNYNFGGGWALSIAPLISANWDAPAGSQWTVPLGLGVTRTTVFNGRPMSLGVAFYGNAAKPDGAPGKQVRFSISLLYPHR
jgi:hypothetical protein